MTMDSSSDRPDTEQQNHMSFALAPIELHNLRTARLHRLREQLETAPFDAVVLTNPESVHYATGYHSVPAQLNRSHPMAVVVTETDLIAVLPVADTAAAADEGLPVEDIVPFGTFYFSGTSRFADMARSHPDIVAALQTALLRLPARTIGLERGPLPEAAVDVVGQRAGKVVDAAVWALQVRSQKLLAEIELLRRSSELAQAGIEAALAIAAPGVTDKEIAAVVATTMSAGGGHPRNLTVGGGERSAYSDVVGAERPLAPGDLLRFDVGCTYFGYSSDMARTAVVGEPTRLQASRYDALLAGLHAEFDTIRPGVSAGEVFAAAIDAVQAHGLTPYRRHHVGHAIGLLGYEIPVITPDNRALIPENGTFSLETPYYEPGWGGMIVEDTGVVRSDGFELFTTTDRTLRIVPA
jgi:Xaa-Pro dipeptidase